MSVELNNNVIMNMSLNRDVRMSASLNSDVRLVSLFNSISTFVGYLMPKPYFLKNSNDAV